MKRKEEISEIGPEIKVSVEVFLERLKVVFCEKDEGWKRVQSLAAIRINDLAIAFVLFITSLQT